MDSDDATYLWLPDQAPLFFFFHRRRPRAKTPGGVPGSGAANPSGKLAETFPKDAATARESSIGPEEISGEIERRFEEYSETVQGAGRYLRQEALHRVLSSVHTEYDGQGEADERREVIDRKRRLCVDDLGACVPAAVEAEDAARGGACDICAAVAVDFDFVARRGGLHEAPRDRGWLVGELEAACAAVSYTHLTLPTKA